VGIGPCHRPFLSDRFKKNTDSNPPAKSLSSSVVYNFHVLTTMPAHLVLVIRAEMPGGVYRFLEYYKHRHAFKQNLNAK